MPYNSSRMKNIRLDDGYAERNEREYIERKEWQHRSKACGHSWRFNLDVTRRLCTLCGCIQIWSPPLHDWVSKSAIDSYAKARSIRERKYRADKRIAKQNTVPSTGLNSGVSSSGSGAKTNGL